jgi:hypothetical protein
VNSTISIDLSKSWTTSDVVLRTIDRPWYSKANQVIWTDQEAGHFYVWGGKWIRGRNMTDNLLWKFTPDGNGGGTWAVENATNAQSFADLHQAEHIVFTNTPDTGFAIGGIASGWTEHYRASNQVIPGMVAYNFKTKIWQNGTTAFSPFDTLSGGAAQYVPNYGANGLVLVLGGTAHRVDSEPDEKTARPFDFRNLTFFDPETKGQYWYVKFASFCPFMGVLCSRNTGSAPELLPRLPMPHTRKEITDIVGQAACDGCHPPVTTDPYVKFVFLLPLFGCHMLPRHPLCSRAASATPNAPFRERND